MIQTIARFQVVYQPKRLTTVSLNIKTAIVDEMGIVVSTFSAWSLITNLRLAIQITFLVDIIHQYVLLLRNVVWYHLLINNGTTKSLQK
mmetsp:Transcript_26012/g.39328  ORF Transcript_26012/g.39328 Transcript_26012/m.39328 type:complete len:89 (+) Transcript_26012:1603-1869(+)